MSKNNQNIGTFEDVEYAIYTFNYDSSYKKKMKWKRHETLLDMSKALNKAELLYRSGNYIKVEVKQKYFDIKRNKKIDALLEVFEDNKKQNSGAIAVLCFAFICAVTAFSVIYYLG